MTVAPDREAARRGRLTSVDAYRGFVMFLMLAEVLRTCEAAALAGSPLLHAVCGQQTHAAWVGASLHDLIQPSFYFLVGLALLLSITRRQASGQRPADTAVHTATRAVVLVVLGMALQAAKPRHWDWYFLDTLTQIGLAYPLLVVIAWQSRRVWLVSCVTILVGYWLWFAMSPLPPPPPDLEAAYIPVDWLSVHGLSGFAAHWQKNSNRAWAFDLWLINWFPRDVPHAGYVTGLTTLNFVPSTATMILGLFAGDALTSDLSFATKVRLLCLAGVALLLSGWLLGAVGICPVVKAIWTPSWVLFSGGWCFIILAIFYAADHAGLTRVLFPLTVIGMNSIIAYAISFIFPAYAFYSFRRLLGRGAFQVFGAVYEPVVYGALVLVLYWLLLLTLYRRRIFIRL